MRPSSKIKAFTLSEVLVVLVITSIVVGIAFAVLRLVTLQLNAIQTTYARSIEVAKFKQRLLYDFDAAATVVWDLENQQLEITTPSAYITYEVFPEYVLRDTDTLAFKVQNIDFYYQGDTVEEGRIDGMHVQLEMAKKQTQFFVSRRSGARDTIERLWE